MSRFVLHLDTPAYHLDELDIDPFEQGFSHGVVDGALSRYGIARNRKYGVDTNKGIEKQFRPLVNGRKMTRIEKKAIRAKPKHPVAAGDLLTKEKGIQFEPLAPAVKRQAAEIDHLSAFGHYPMLRPEGQGDLVGAQDVAVLIIDMGKIRHGQVDVLAVQGAGTTGFDYGV
jgi:hypothetical protein